MRILFVAMPGSVHTARWINEVSNLGWDIYLFASTPEPVHSDFRNLTIYGFSSFRPKGLDHSVRIRGLFPLRRGASTLGRQANHYLPWVSPWALAGMIRWLKPDIVHSMEIQHAGYLTLAAREVLKGKFPPWIVSNWGSDIYLFGRLSEHQHKIKAVMSACSFLSFLSL